MRIALLFVAFNNESMSNDLDGLNLDSSSITEVEKNERLKYKSISDGLLSKFSSDIFVSYKLCDLSVDLKDAAKLLDVVSYIKSVGFSILVDICGADYPEKHKRFCVIYHFLNIKTASRIRLKLFVSEDESVESSAGIYPCACWFEREAFDMFGIKFVNSPDLRRILTDYNFEGFPLRKDFPLTGFKEIKYSKEEGKIVESDVFLTQEYRSFDFEMPWESAKYDIEKNNK